MKQEQHFVTHAAIALVMAVAVAAIALAGSGRTAAHGDPAALGADQDTDCPRRSAAGELLWAFRTDGANATDGMILGAPAIGPDGTLAVGVVGGRLYGLSCRGTWRWQVNMPPLDGGRSAILSSPVLHTDQQVYIGAASNVRGALLAVNSDGTSPRMITQPEPFAGSVVVDPQGRVFAGSSAPRLSTGSIAVFDRELVPLPGFPVVSNPINAAPVYLHNHRVVFASMQSPGGIGASSGTGTATTVFPIRRTATPTISVTRPSSATPTESRTAVPTATVRPTERGLDLSTATPRPQRWSAFLPHARKAAVDLPAAARNRKRFAAVPAPQATPTVLPFPTSAAGPPPPRVRHSHLHIIADARAPGKAYALSESQTTSVIATGDVVIVSLAERPPRIVALAVDSDPPVILWEHFSAEAIAGSPVLGTLDPSTGRVELVYAGIEGILVSLSVPGTPAAGGGPTFNWAIRLDQPVVSAPVLGDAGMLYIATEGSVLAVDRADGSPGWRFDWSPGSNGVADAGRITGALALSPGGALYVGTQHHLVAISTEARGLDPDARWPASRRDARNSGWAEP